jgi:hypothetical protein
MRADQVARQVHVTVSDARAGIGAIIGMINAIAQGSPGASLRPNPSLASAVGPFMSMDQAMSRFGSHMGPIVGSPRPFSPMWQPDFAPDRELGAGRAGAARGRGHSAMRSMFDYGEAGDISANLDSAAHALIDYVTHQGYGPDPTISDFQDAFNHEFAPPTPLAVDGRYGRLTHDALESVIHAAPASSDLAQETAPPAPAPAPSGGGGGGGPGTVVLPATTITGTPPVAHPVSQASMFSSPWTWAGLALIAGAAVISQSKHPPRWARKIGLHR